MTTTSSSTSTIAAASSSSSSSSYGGVDRVRRRPNVDMRHGYSNAGAGRMIRSTTTTGEGGYRTNPNRCCAPRTNITGRWRRGPGINSVDPSPPVCPYAYR
ncbi:hypothetical protein ACHAXA_008098 [Cyclostephanos tholiformis]|uniref:Uncharacterized protein n=1 Tax=Cyclostephanos tholiformis TaxID=382380 RepID=A0ABD3RVP1_9STRA